MGKATPNGPLNRGHTGTYKRGLGGVGCGGKNVDDWLTGPAYNAVAVTWGSGASNDRERSDWRVRPRERPAPALSIRKKGGVILSERATRARAKDPLLDAPLDLHRD